MSHGRKYYLLSFIFITFLNQSRCFSQDDVLRFKIDMRKPEYEDLYCSNLPLCDEYMSFCNTYNKDIFQDSNLDEECYRLKKKCYSSEKCCTGKIGCCDGRCSKMYQDSFTTVMINICGFIYLISQSSYLYFNLIRVSEKQS